MKFNPSRGGHAPGYLRDALIDALQESWAVKREWWELTDISFFNPSQQLWWHRLDQRHRALWVLGQLWNCTDVVPNGTCDFVAIRRGSSFATLARYLRSDMESLDLESSGPEAA